jgi:hypothetical protein
MTNGVHGRACARSLSAPYALHAGSMRGMTTRKQLGLRAPRASKEEVDPDGVGSLPHGEDHLARIALKSRHFEVVDYTKAGRLPPVRLRSLFPRRALMAFAAVLLRSLPWRVRFHDAWTRSS